MKENRNARRYHCSEPVDCFFLGKPAYASLSDVSLLGGRLRGEGLPEPGTLFMIAPLDSGVAKEWVTCQVCWICRGPVQEVGVRFLEPVSRLKTLWVHRLIPAQPAERRNAVRVPAEVHVEIQLDGLRRPIEASSVDLSQGGARVRLPRTLRRDAVIGLYLCLPWCLLDVPAQVARRDSSDRLVHSFQFLESSPAQEDALGYFLRQEAGQTTNSSTSSSESA